MLHQCHTNRYNLHNQVGLIALSCYGTPYAPATPGSGYPAPPSSSSSALDKLESYEASVKEKIKEVIVLKDAAVAREDFDAAKDFKTAID